VAGKPVGSFYVGLGLDTREFQRKMKQADRDLQRAFGSSAIRTSELLAASIAGVAVAAGAVAAASVKLAADLEVQEKAFERLLNSADAAKDKLSELQTFAAETPFTFTELTDATKRLLALGYSADEVKPVLTSLGDAAFGLGRGNEGLHLMIKAFGDIRTKGYLMTQEIKQLAENGVPAFEILAEKIGVSIPEAMKMVEDRAISSETAITAFMSGINERFGGMMEIQSKTMIGLLSTIRDEAENIMRQVGNEIVSAFGLKEVLKEAKSQLLQFRADVENLGLVDALSRAMGDKLRIAVYAAAGAIMAALIPAVIALGIALKTALAPIALLVGLGLLAGAAAGAISSLAQKYSSSIKIIKEAVSTTATYIKNVVVKTIDEVLGTVALAVSKVIQLFADSARSHYLTALADGLQKTADNLKHAAVEYKGNADLLSAQNSALKEHLSLLWENYQQNTQWLDFMSGQGLDNVVVVYDRVTAAISRLTRNMGFLADATRNTKDLPVRLEEMAGGLASVAKRSTSMWNNILGLGKGAKSPPDQKQKGPSEADKLAEDAKRTSESILQSYTSQVLGKKALLELEYQNEREALEKTKAYNANYRRDSLMLDEMYYQRRVELAREAADEEAKLNVEIAQSRADYIQKQMEADWAEAEANAQRIQAIQDGSALEAQLQADMQAADLAAYIAHLDQKQAAYRAHLEGNRNLMEVYDQLQRDAHRTNADYMAEGYRTIYYGMSDMLTNIITGAKNAGEAFKELGMQIIQMVVKWQIQRRLAAVMSKTLEATQLASSTAMAAATAAAWAPAAAMVAAATFGASTASAAAGLTGLTAMSRALAIPGLAEGGIVTKPTLAMIGEGNESEAVIPLSKLEAMRGNGGANVQLNVINQTGIPVQATSRQHTDGAKIVVDLLLEGMSRNIGGIQDVIGRRS